MKCFKKFAFAPLFLNKPLLFHLDILYVYLEPENLESELGGQTSAHQVIVAELSESAPPNTIVVVLGVNVLIDNCLAKE